MNRSLLLTRCITKIAASAVASLLLWAFAPLLIGWTPVVITSGSMMPMVRPGDIVVTAPVPDPAELAAGDVITYRQPGSDQRVTHRIDTVGDDGILRTKGDANQQPDTDPLPPDRIEGTARILVPYAGLAATSPTVRIVAAAVLLLTVALRLRRHNHDHPPTGASATPSPAARPVPDVAAAPGPPVAAARIMTARRPAEAARPAAAPAARLFTAGVRERVARRRRHQASGATLALLAVAVAVPVTAVAAFTGNSAHAGTFTADVLAPPSGLTATAQCVDATAQVTLTWTTSTSTVDSQTMARADGDSPATAIATLDASANSHVDANVPAGTATYTLSVTRASWTSTDSTPASVTVPIC